MSPHRALVLPTLILGAAAALGVGLLPAAATAVPTPAAPVDAAFTPTLTFVTCPGDEVLPPRTRCARLTAPLDWQTPDDGRTIQIAIRITTPRRDAGMLGLTWNPGGPGGGAVDGHRDTYLELPRAVRNRFDWVSWDPRGVGQSEPKLSDCQPVSVTPPDTGPVDWDAYWQEAEVTESGASAACFAANPQAAPYLGTWQVVRDLDAMREALGYDRWNYWGMSYGTRIGNTYARTFPDRLRALIQDGSVMASETIARFGGTSPAGNYEAVQVYASLVGRRQAFKIRTIGDYLDDSVIDTGEGVLTRWSFSTLVNVFLRSQSMYPLAKEFINELFAAITATGPVERRRVARAIARAEEQVTPDPASDAFIVKFVNCADMSDRPTAAQLARMSRQAEQLYGTAYALGSNRAELCLGLPAGYSPSTPNGDATIALPIPPLFLLSTGDAATPWVWGRSLANTFARSRTVTYDSTQHVNFGVPSACLNNVVERYLLTLRLPRTDISCPYVPSGGLPR